MSADREHSGGVPVACETLDLSWEGDQPLSRAPTTGKPAAGLPAMPMLHLDGFDRPMDLLLDLAER
ncbi:hypothetical protein ACELLULO517_26400 [Acidisoma cellulosilytica]|uniref:Uncharacterized protein n=1 Tax=Acidisoma cellulosilyticum TaxID=2802395 RepID=A0A963Z745_9PROT|nr:hypothetical protein [Acidisoma cellulosilyticum]MCB8883806.1 hypothetical protein [Acidisoma cellulosilyticum]